MTASCEITVNPILATSVTLNTTNLSLLIGQSKQITANVKPTNTTDATVTWKSSDEAIAKVSADGTVAAVSVGVATITATCGEVSATCKVTVNPVVASSVTLNVKDLTLLVGQSDKLTATVEPVNTTDATVSWKSSNESIAKVSSDGTVTAVSVGVATITATCGAVSASCKVTVNPVVASSVMLNVADMTLLVGQSDKLTPTVEPANTTDATITWKSSDESIATVSEDGTVTAISVGVATITATCGEVSATCKVTVNPPLATGITLDRESYEGLVGESFVLTPTILPVNASKEIKWESLDEDVSTVTENGEVVIIGPGTAIITASTTDGSNLSASCEVTAWLRGDSNGDNMVDVADVVNCINYIADNPVEKFIYIATDLNGDKDITVTDATLIAQLILNSTASSNAARQLPAMRMNGTNNIGYVNVTDKDNFVTLAMSNSGYSAFQTDLILPEGVEFEDARLVNGAKGTHTLMSSVEENRVRLILFSLDNSELKAGETFVELSLKGTHSCYDMISVENSVVSDASAHSYAISARYNGNSSGVSSINDSDEIMIKTTSTGITVLGAINKQINIYSLDGMVIYSDVADSNSESISLNKGTYVVKVGDKVQTVQISNF